MMALLFCIYFILPKRVPRGGFKSSSNKLYQRNGDFFDSKKQRNHGKMSGKVLGLQ